MILGEIPGKPKPGRSVPFFSEGFYPRRKKEERGMDIQYLLFLQEIREATGGVLNSFFLQISDLSYGIFIWMPACVLFWSVDKKSGRFLFLNIGFSRFFM